MRTAARVHSCGRTSAAAAAAAPGRRHAALLLVLALVCCAVATAAVPEAAAAPDSTTCGSSGSSSSGSCKHASPLAEQEAPGQWGVGALNADSVAVAHARKLLQGSSVTTACSSRGGGGGSSAADAAAVQQIAQRLVGDSRLQVKRARFFGSCRALGAAYFAPPNVFAGMFPAAVVLSTGDAQQAAGDAQDPGHMLSTDLQQPGDASIGAYTQDAAVLEVELHTGPSLGPNQQLVLSYLFASDEYGTKTPNPDVLSLTLTAHSSSSSSSGVAGAVKTADLAVLPGGEHLQPPAVADGAVTPTVKVFSNAAGRYRTAFNGFTQVMPSQGFSVQPSSTYTLRLAVADAHHGLVDSVLMVPAGAVRLAPAPTAATGGPYAVAPNSKLTLRGEKSASPNGAILSYRWSITPAAAGSGDGSRSDPSSSSRWQSERVMVATGASATVATPPPGQYTVTLEVWDSVGGYAAADTPLSVNADNVLSWWSSNPGFAAQAPAIAPRPTAVLSVNGSRAETLLVKARSDAPAVVDLDGSASHASKGVPLAFSWSVTQTEPAVKEVDVLVGFAQPPRLLQSLDPGLYLVTLEVTGPGGTSSKQVLLTVTANTPPVAMPGGPYVATVGKPVFIDGSGSTDPDGDPLSYSWTLSRDGAVIGRYNSTSLSMTLNRPGAYTVQLTVRDNRGGVSSASTELNSYITAPPPAAPAGPQRSAASIAMAPAATAALPAPPNARTSSAASLSQAMPSAVGQVAPGMWGQAAAAPYLPGTAGALAQPAAYAPGLLQQQQQQQQLPQQQQPVGQGYQTGGYQTRGYQTGGYQPGAFQQPYQQQQQLQMLQQQAAYQMPQQPYMATGLQDQTAAGFAPGMAVPEQAAALAGGPGQLQTGMPPQQQQQQQQQQPSATPTGRTMGMCLFKDGKPDYNPADAQAALKGLLPNSNWAPCPMNTAMFTNAPTGIPAAPALDPQPPAPPAAPAAAAAAPAATPVATAAAAPATPVATAAAAPAASATPAATGPAADDAAAAASGNTGGSNSSGNSSSGGGSNISSTAGAATTAGAAEAAQSKAVITAPEAFVKAEGAVTQVQLDAGGSAAAPDRSLIAYRWTVRSKADGSLVTSISGQRTPVWLAPGEYSLQLQVTDTAGQTAVADKAFAVGDVAATAAHISSPAGFVQQLSDGGAVEVQLSASGSQAGPGRSIVGYNWTVIRLPDNSQVAAGSGPVATTSLASGSYEVQLVVTDSSGGSATAKQSLRIGGKGTTGATAVIAWPPTVVNAGAAAAAAAAGAGVGEASAAAATAGAAQAAAGGSSSSSGSNLGSNGDGKSLVTLDASGSSPSRPDGAIRECVWAVLSMPRKTLAANATGRVASVRLPPGSYQVGLLVLDADGGTASARKNFVVQEGPGNNRAPVVTPGLRLSGAAGSNISISEAVSDPDGDTVRVSWNLLDQVSGVTVSGQGFEVPLAGLSPDGYYLLLVTATDSRGGEGSGTVHLTVVAPKAEAPAKKNADAKHATVSVAGVSKPGSGGSGSSSKAKTSKQSTGQASKQSTGQPSQAAAAAVASIFQGPSGPKKLPVLSMPQGSVLALDAAAFALAPSGGTKSYSWELQQRGTGHQVATVYGHIGRFELSKLDAYNIRLLATDAQGKEYASTGSVRVLDPSEGQQGSGQALNPGFAGSVVQAEGQCGPFKAQQYAAAVLECPELQLQPLAPSALTWAWKVTLLHRHENAAAGGSDEQAAEDEDSSSSSSSGGGSSRGAGPPKVQAQLGATATFLGLAPGTYRVEVAVGVGSPPSSHNTAYYLATLLHVAPTRGLEVKVPSTAVCAGEPISLEAPDLQLAPGEPQAELRWRVVMEQSPTALFAAAAAAAGAAGAAAGAGGSKGNAGEAAAVVKGAGKTFGFTLQPGRYEVQLTAHMPDGSILSGSGVINALACVGCKAGPVEVVLPRGRCAATDAQAQLVMSGPLPAGLEVKWADGTDTSLGSRPVTVVAKLPGGATANNPGSGARTAAAPSGGKQQPQQRKLPSCGAVVHFRDAEPPELQPLHEEGLCLAPANSLWSCMHAHQLVSIRDNCGDDAQLAFRVSCGGSSGGSSSGSSGGSRSSSSSSDNCQVLPDGRVCVRAAAAGQVSLLQVTARDGSGNVAGPVEIPVKVLAKATKHRECSRPEWLQPQLQQ